MEEAVCPPSADRDEVDHATCGLGRVTKEGRGRPTTQLALVQKLVRLRVLPFVDRPMKSHGVRPSRLMDEANIVEVAITKKNTAAIRNRLNSFLDRYPTMTEN